MSFSDWVIMIVVFAIMGACGWLLAQPEIDTRLVELMIEFMES